MADTGADLEADFVVVGSGAGGGPLAANLALAGYSVILLEAGGDDRPPEYEVPAFYTEATEHPAMAWDFYVRHYADQAQQKRDCKYTPEKDGVLYPRSGTLGGCTAHHAMIIIYPHPSDWDRIAALTGDDSWKASEMKGYFRRLEQCRFLGRPPRWWDIGRHGYFGWLPTEMADLRFVIQDWQVLRLALAGFLGSLEGRFWSAIWEAFTAWLAEPCDPLTFFKRYCDPTTRPHAAEHDEGLYYVPLSVDGVMRVSTRDRILEAAKAGRGRLQVVLHALASRVLFDKDKRATGVEYLAGEHLYGADPNPRKGASGERRVVRARREVILSAGAFNSPQLLKLSGIGPKAELEKLGIPVVADRPGVGENLQDRYEISVVNEIKHEFTLTKGATFRAPKDGAPPDPLYAQWLKGRGPYGTNGGIVAVAKRSGLFDHPDLFNFVVPGLFRGYFPGYSSTIAQERNFFSWIILKSHVANTKGQVLLRSADPRDTPRIDFHYFQEGTGGGAPDLKAVSDAVEFARSLSARTKSMIVQEVKPGPAVKTRADIEQWVKDDAWGHHASCTCKIGPASDPMAVVDARFRVHGVTGLRVVDASVFPYIPGFFIVSAVYMIAEKASDVIIADNGGKIAAAA